MTDRERTHYYGDGCPEHSSRSCGDFLAGGHAVFDPECETCIEASSDAPEWTLS